MATVKLEIVSPDKLVYSEDIEMLIVRSTSGEIGFLPKHTPLVAGLLPHAMRIKKDSREELVAVSGGFVEVQPNKITVLASTAEMKQDIDEARAHKSYDRAKDRIAKAKNGDPNIDLVRAEASLKRAVARLNAAGHSVA